MRKLLFLILFCSSFGWGQSTTYVDPWSTSRWFDTLGIAKVNKFGLGGNKTAESNPGLPIIVDTVNSLLTNVAMPLKTLNVQENEGFYRISYYAYPTDTGSVGKAILKIRWGVPTDSVTVDTDSLNLTLSTAYIQGSRIIYVDPDANPFIRILGAITGTTGNPSYFVMATLEYLFSPTGN